MGTPEFAVGSLKALVYILANRQRTCSARSSSVRYLPSILNLLTS